MTETFLANYFEHIATKLKEIRHTDNEKAFYRMADPNDLDEFDNAVKNMGKNICLLLEIGSGEIADWDSQKESDRLGLHVLVKTSEAKDAINAGRDQAKTVLQKIVSKMRLDCKIGADRPDNTIGPLKSQGISFDSKIKFSNMTAIDGNWYGKSFYFDFKAPVNLVYQSNDWL